MNEKFSIDVTVCNGKYRVIMSEDGNLKARRYGKPWRSLIGDNLIYWLTVELQEQRLLCKEHPNGDKNNE